MARGSSFLSARALLYLDVVAILAIAQAIPTWTLNPEFSAVNAYEPDPKCQVHGRLCYKYAAKTQKSFGVKT